MQIFKKEHPKSLLSWICWCEHQFCWRVTPFCLVIVGSWLSPLCVGFWLLVAVEWLQWKSIMNARTEVTMIITKSVKLHSHIISFCDKNRDSWQLNDQQVHTQTYTHTHTHTHTHRLHTHTVIGVCLWGGGGGRGGGLNSRQRIMRDEFTGRQQRALCWDYALKSSWSCLKKAQNLIDLPKVGWWGGERDSSVVGEGLPNWSQMFMHKDLTTLGQTSLCSWIYSLDGRSSRFKTSQHWDRLHYILSYTYLKDEILTWRVYSTGGVGGALLIFGGRGSQTDCLIFRGILTWRQKVILHEFTALG